ncbi:hypothetical protein HRbin19_00960 [bacterium HR19]|nr:hypothetical protein HRbin19_00960 [bacterium HR19]
MIEFSFEGGFFEMVCGRRKHFTKRYFYFGYVFLFLIFLLSCGRFSGDYETKTPFSLSPAEYLISAGDSGLFNHFAQDKNGGVHVVYYNMLYRTVFWAYAPDLQQTGFRNIEMIDEAGQNDNFGLSPKVVIDSQNIPHVIYIRHKENGEDSFSIYHAQRLGDNKWKIEKVQNPCPYESKAELLSAVIDPEDIIHIAYIGMDKRVYYISLGVDGKTMRCEQVDPAVGEVARVPSGGAISGCIDMKIDEAGTLRLAYYDSENGNVKYAYRKKDEQNWVISVVGWDRVFNEEIQFISLNPTQYQAELKFPSNESRFDSSLFAIGPGGRKEVPKDFWRFKSQKYVLLDASAVGPGKEFDLNTMKFYISYVRTDTSPDDEGIFCSAGYNKNFDHYIAYFNSTKLQVEFAYFQAGSWVKEVVDKVPVGSQIQFINYKISQDVWVPVIFYSDSIRWNIKSAFLLDKPERRWIVNTLIAKGIAGIYLFADFMPNYSNAGLSYMKNINGDYVLYFSLFEIPKEIKEQLTLK